jgi:DNA topoisomerase II
MVKKNKKVDYSKIYQKKTHHEHILSLSDTYIGSIEPEMKEMYIYEDNKIKKKNIEYIGGLYKLFDEGIVNSRDHTIRDKTCKTIKVNIDRDTNRITIMNDGTPIPIDIHPEHNVYYAELIFGHLLTSSNYEQKGKTVGGKNGYGAKLINIYSTEFVIDVCDHKAKKRYYQKFTNNMYKKEKPIITKYDKRKSYTSISFIPDFSRFKTDRLSDDMIALFKKRVYDIAACTQNKIKVYLDDELIKVDNFEEYINMFYSDDNKPEHVFEIVNNRWTIGVIYDPSAGYTHVSYVNGICTFQGGRHVDHVMSQIINGVVKYINNKHKNINVKNSHVRDNLTLFINCVIEDPSFTSQTKEYLSNKVSDFGSKCDLSDKFIQSLTKTGLIDEVVQFAKLKAMVALSKSDGKKRSVLKGLTKLDDANWAGKRKSSQCRLILTEGDSAKAFAISGLKLIGRDKYGVFPLRGKLLNVREATAKQLVNNEEIKNIKKIMGLKQNVKYEESDLSKLRYGGIIILADQDVDGTHIKGLLINFIHVFWPSLLKVKGFIQSMATPIIKAFKKKDVKKKNPKIFYTLTEYKNWVDSNKKINDWKIKYYKGLGTSSNKEALECFNNFEDNLINYVWEESDKKTDKKQIIKELKIDDSTDSEKSKEDKESVKEEFELDLNSDSYKSITLAFSKIQAGNRKVWLRNYDPENILENSEKNVTYTDFINKDLIHFSNSDNLRSLPSIYDGLKPSQRKIIYASFERKLEKDEVKVSQLAGYVSDKASYHHGEMSLQGAIINMAQEFVGSNNINLLMANGQFGTRRMGGKDAASARYLHTMFNKLTLLLYRKEDNPIYEHIIDDNHVVEPRNYCPILPMILVNGSKGIGTGFSTTIPCFNPLEITEALLNKMKGKQFENLKPWYSNFKGEINYLGNNVYQTSGLYQIKDKNTIKITELPIGRWTQTYRDYLESILVDDPKKPEKKDLLLGYKDYSGNNDVEIEITLLKGKLQEILKNKNNKTFSDVFKLKEKVSTTNMHLYNCDGIIHKYKDVKEILEEYYTIRIKTYNKRKEYYVKLLKNQMMLLKYKVLFIKDYIKKKVVIEKKKRQQVFDKLEELKYPKLSNKLDDLEENKNYNYTDMPIYTLTEEKMNDLQKQYDGKLKEYNEYLNTQVEDIWKSELNEFKKYYLKWLDENKPEVKKVIKIKTKKKKKKGKNKKVKN